MLKDSLAKALSDQFHAELYSSYLYLSMAADADRKGYKGVANWFHVQTKEEMSHASRIYRHLLDRRAAPEFKAIDAPNETFGSIKEIFEKALAHERKVSEMINGVASLALNEHDHATYDFVMWFVKEQIEEETSTEEILAKISLMGENTGQLYHLNAELASRAFNDPFPNNL